MSGINRIAKIKKIKPDFSFLFWQLRAKIMNFLVRELDPETIITPGIHVTHVVPIAR